MSYKHADIPDLKEGEKGYQLDSGDYVAGKVTSCAQGASGTMRHQMRFCAKARAVHKDGTAVTWADGEAVEATHGFHVDAADIVLYGDATHCAKIALKIVLGEPDAIASVNDDVRDLITAAQHDGKTIDVD
jgi:hypothetical protein